MDIRNIDSMYSLLDLLNTKGMNHEWYYHYTNWDSVKHIIEGKSFLLTRGNSDILNDQHEAQIKGQRETWERTYLSSFAFGLQENMAMWGLYGLPWEDAIRICIPKAAMLQWVNGITEIFPWRNGHSQGAMSPARVRLSDIVYADGFRGGPLLKLTHSGKNIKLNTDGEFCDLDKKEEMTGFIKNIAWSYENEVRLHIQLPFAIGYDKIKVTIPDDVISQFKFTTGPSFLWKNDSTFTQLQSEGRITASGFAHLVRFRPLCQLCRHQQFERAE